MALNDSFRKISDRLEDIEKQGARNTNARTLELLAIAISKKHPSCSTAIHHIAEAHRRVIANANPSLVLDAMFGKILLQN
jgi:hypothetical protein